MAKHDSKPPEVKSDPVPEGAIPLVPIEVPVLVEGGGYTSLFVAATLANDEAMVLKALRKALDVAGLRIRDKRHPKDGRHVVSNTDALRWLLQTIAGGMAENMEPLEPKPNKSS